MASPASEARTALTPEQQAALQNTQSAVRLGRKQSVYVAYAGAGKTFILLQTAARLDGEILLLAFNSAIIQDLQARLRPFGQRVRAMTSHQLALRSLPQDFQKAVKESLREHNGQLTVPDIAKALQIQPFNDGKATWTPVQLAGIAKKTMARFCHTADAELSEKHIPFHQRIPAPMVAVLLETTRQLWQAQQELSLPITHDAYFKLWALGNPQIPEGYRMIDEAQDTNPALYGVLFGQTDGMNIWAGDPYQSIYSWRGAKNAIEIANQQPGAVSSRLTQSFRFGEESAAMASRLLFHIGEDHPVRGSGSTKVQAAPDHIQPQDVATKVSSPFAWIAFTNGALIQAALSCAKHGIPFHIVGQGREQLSLLFSAAALKRGEIHPNGPLAAYRYWSDLEEEADLQPDSDAAKLVRMANYPGFHSVIEALKKSLPQESGAKVIFSTVHAAKGREWDLVVLDKDLDATRDTGERRLYLSASGYLHFDNREDIHLRYVAITRARKRLVMACPTLYHWLTR
jgi:superfamily I DNA/RNA helicase